VSVTQSVSAAGYTGDIEVEIFNQTIWKDSPMTVIDRVIRAFAHTGL